MSSQQSLYRDANRNRNLTANGTDIYIDTSNHTGDWFQVELNEAGTFSSITVADCTVPTGTELAAGTIIASRIGITQFQMDSATQVTAFKN